MDFSSVKVVINKQKAVTSYCEAKEYPMPVAHPWQEFQRNKVIQNEARKKRLWCGGPGTHSWFRDTQLVDRKQARKELPQVVGASEKKKHCQLNFLPYHSYTHL